MIDNKKLAFNLNRDKDELRGILVFLQDMIRQSLEALDDEHLFGLNELGIFQGNANRADILAAKIKLQHRLLTESEK